MTLAIKLSALIFSAITSWYPNASDSFLGKIEDFSDSLAVEALEFYPCSPDKAYALAVSLAFIAERESQFADDIDDGRCNLRRTQRCDWGQSFTWFQIYMPHIYLSSVTHTYTSGWELLADRSHHKAIKAAIFLYMIRPTLWSTWRSAKKRRDLWIGQHPWTVTPGDLEYCYN